MRKRGKEGDEKQRGKEGEEKKGEEGEGYLSLALFSRIRSMLREGAG